MSTLDVPLAFGAGGGVSQATANGLYANLLDTKTATPTTGQTVTMTDNTRDGVLVITPAGLLAALTVTLPTNANSRVGQRRSFSTTQAVTTLTVNGASSILNAPASLLAGDHYTFQKTAANTWMRCQ